MAFSWYHLGPAHLESLPDLNGDGFREILVGDVSYSQEFFHAGRVFVLSGAFSGLTPDVLLEAYGTGVYHELGNAVAGIGDVDQDGLPDFAAAAQGAPPSYVYSGKNAAVLLEHPTGSYSITALGDLNGDGIGGFLFGCPIYYGGGSVYVYDGRTLQQRYVLEAYGSFFGGDTAAMGDIDNDGICDFAVGAPGLSNLGEEYIPSGRVSVYSGVDGDRLYSLRSPPSPVSPYGGHPNDLFGVALAAPGDLNGDGAPDLVVGSAGCCVAEFAGPGKVFFYEGRTGELLDLLDPLPWTVGVGQTVVEAGDLDGNGVGDVIVSFWDGLRDVPGLWLVEGRTRRTLSEWRFPQLGEIARGGLDWNGDDFPDVLAPVAPAIALYSGAPPGIHILGEPCSAARGEPPPRIATGRQASIGAPFEVNLSRVPPGVDAFLLVGDLLPSPGDGCSIQIEPARIFRTRTEAVSPDKGAASVTIPIRLDPALAGSLFHAQWIVGSLRGVPPVTTRVMRVEIEPRLPSKQGLAR